MEVRNINIGKNEIDLLKNIIDDINEIAEININEPLFKERITLLYDKISKEDLQLFLMIMNKIKKVNINKMKKLLKENNKNLEQARINENIIAKFSLDEIEKIFETLTDDEINKKYKLSDLQAIYLSLYRRMPVKNKSKKVLIEIIRNYIHTINRAKAFNRLS